MSQILVWILGGVTLVAGVVVAGFLVMQGQEEGAGSPAPVPLMPQTVQVSEPPSDEPAPQVPVQATAGVPETPADEATMPEAEAPQTALASDSVAAQPAPVAPTPPRFDVVRVARDGGALVAGEAMPGAAVTLRVDGLAVAQAAADGAGQFVAIFSLAPSEAVQVLTLEMEGADGVVIASDDTVVLTPRPGPMAVAALEPAPETPTIPAVPDRAAVADGAQGPDVATALETAPAQTGSVLTAPAAPMAVAQAEVVVVEAPGGVSMSDPGSAGAPVPVAGDGGAPGSAGVEVVDTATGSAAITAPTAEPAPQIAANSPVSGDVAPQNVAPQNVAPQNAAPDNAGPENPVPDLGAAPVVASAGPNVVPADLPTAFLVRGTGAVEVLDRAPQLMDNVVIDSISYSAEGDVQIAGRSARADPASNLRIYLNNEPIAVARSERGDWASDLPSIDPGVYTLRVDQLNPEGQVVSRFETPFQREAPELIAAAQGEAPAAAAVTAPTRTEPARATTVPVSLITVQPGHTLWAISNERYGAGELYVVIYRANRNQIGDPDLIYPGQIFTLPDN